jgi:hypothetical protein
LLREPPQREATNAARRPVHHRSNMARIKAGVGSARPARRAGFHARSRT